MDEHSKALMEALKYMRQVDTLMKTAIDSTKVYYKESDYLLFPEYRKRGYREFQAIKDLTKRMAKDINWPLKGEWWK